MCSVIMIKASWWHHIEAYITNPRPRVCACIRQGASLSHVSVRYIQPSLHDCASPRWVRYIQPSRRMKLESSGRILGRPTFFTVCMLQYLLVSGLY
jgi:hypothetical protein